MSQSTGADKEFLPISYSVPSGSVAAVKDQSSQVTILSPRIAVDLAPLSDAGHAFQVLALAYTPDFVFYHSAPSESYVGQRFATAIKSRKENFSFDLDNGFTYIDGSELGAFYPGSLYNAYGVAGPRERRQQIQDRSVVTFQYDKENWFVRPTASLLYYDLMTKLENLPGYQNYADRYDMNGGADVGYRIGPHLAMTAGYRYGHQFQEQFSFSPYSSSSDYQRVLLGTEGKPWKWLEIRVQGGPDFRTYPEDSSKHITPIEDKRPITYYGEACLTAAITTNNVISFKYKQFRWVSSLGKIPYFDSAYDLCYRRRLSNKVVFDLKGKILSSDYTIGNLATCLRDDWEYSTSPSLSYNFNAHFSFTLAYCLNLGRNAQEGIANPQTREYNRDLFSVGASVKF